MNKHSHKLRAAFEIDLSIVAPVPPIAELESSDRQIWPGLSGLQKRKSIESILQVATLLFMDTLLALPLAGWINHLLSFVQVNVYPVYLPVFIGLCFACEMYKPHKSRYVLGRFFLIESILLLVLSLCFLDKGIDGSILGVILGASVLKGLLLSSIHYFLTNHQTTSDENCFFHKIEKGLKRCIDFVLASAGLVILSPVFGLVSGLICLESKGHAFFRQMRIGRNERVFHIFKFRSMYLEQDHCQHQLRKPPKALFKMENDPRITRIGRIIRKLSIDELPQLWNVVQGDMSLVGPRPPVLEEYEAMNSFHRMKFRAVSGITGLWQIEGRVKNERNFDSVAHYDIQYLQDWSLFYDFLILLKTLPVVLFQRGAF